MDVESKKATKNTSMLYLMNIAKMVFPLVTLPYLTRVLSVDCYAVVAYIKAVMQYVQIALIFGFTLSATKDIVNAREDREQIGRITGSVLEAKGLLSIIVGFILLIMTLLIPLLRENPLYTFLAFINTIITEMLADFLFRGIDRMEVITVRFVISKLISTFLTFVFINNDSDILLIPIFDILGSIFALFLVLLEIRKLGIIIVRSPIKDVLIKLKESAIYFVSDMATTAFGALNTILVGIFATRTDVSYWSLCMQLVSAVQSMYTPITSGIYPTMIRTKSIVFLKKITMIIMPIVTAGCIICLMYAGRILTIVGGNQYADAYLVFQALVPVLFFSFPAMLYGWPALGSIGKQKETTISTVVTAIIQIVGLVVLLVINQFSLVNIALLRGFTELIMLLIRGQYVFRYRALYNN